MEVHKYTGEHACRMGLAASIISLVTLVCWLVSLCIHKADQPAKVTARPTYKYKDSLQESERHGTVNMVSSSDHGPTRSKR